MPLEIPPRLELLGQHVAGSIASGASLGLGSGSTAEAFVRALGARVREGLEVTAVSTSSRTAGLAAEHGIRIVELDEVERLDLGIDGADEIDPSLNLVKGRGGALLYEKLVAMACDQFLILSADEKLVDQLGSRIAVPVEVMPVGWSHTARRLEALGCRPHLRPKSAGYSDEPFLTDGGHYILDCATGPIFDPVSFGFALKECVGVVEHGLFIGMADRALVVDSEGKIRELSPAHV